MVNDFLVLNNKNDEEEKERRIGILMSVLLHLLLLLLCLIPFFQNQYPPEKQGGVIVDFGNTTEETAQESEPEAPEQTLANLEATAEPIKTENATTEDIHTEEKPASKSAEITSPITQEDSPVVVDKVKENKKLEAERTAERAREEARKKAEAEKARIEEEKRKKQAYQESKKGFKDLFSKGTSSSSSTAGDQGNPDGDPSADNIDQLLTGDGTIGGSLGTRQVTYIPTVTDNSQKEGRVVIKVCVDASGSVSEASFTQSGSTTNDPILINKAIAGAKKYKFNATDIDTQCGTITFDFKLK